MGTKSTTHISKSLAMWAKWFQAKHACSRVLAKVGLDIQFLEKALKANRFNPWKAIPLVVNKQELHLSCLNGGNNVA